MHLNKLKKKPNDTFLRHSFFANKKEYKPLVKKQKRQFHSALLDKIDALAGETPKEYWKLVNSRWLPTVILETTNPAQ